LLLDEAIPVYGESRLMYVAGLTDGQIYYGNLQQLFCGTIDNCLGITPF
jgi:hypothetical protein